MDDEADSYRRLFFRDRGNWTVDKVDDVEW